MAPFPPLGPCPKPTFYPSLTNPRSLAHRCEEGDDGAPKELRPPAEGKDEECPSHLRTLPGVRKIIKPGALTAGKIHVRQPAFFLVSLALPLLSLAVIIRSRMSWARDTRLGIVVGEDLL